MGRAVLSVFAGFVAWSVCWFAGNGALRGLFASAYRKDGSTEDVGLLLATLLLAMAVTCGAGFVAAKVAPGQGARQGVILGVVLLAVGIAVQIQYWKLLPLWYHLCFLAQLLPLCVWGASRVKAR